MWPGLIQKSKDGGLDVIETYVFWNLHEPVRNQVLFLRFIDTRATSWFLGIRFVGLDDNREICLLLSCVFSLLKKLNAMDGTYLLLSSFPSSYTFSPAKQWTVIVHFYMINI